MADTDRAREIANGRDPYVYQRARVGAALNREQRHRDRRKLKWARRPEETGDRLRRRQSIILGALFALLALVIYFVAQATAPRIVVQVDGASGYVVVDGQTVGRTGETIRGITAGNHIIQVVPDTRGIEIVPPQHELEISYAMIPYTVRFTAVQTEGDGGGEG